MKGNRMVKLGDRVAVHVGSVDTNYCVVGRIVSVEYRLTVFRKKPYRVYGVMVQDRVYFRTDPVKISFTKELKRALKAKEQ